MCSQNFAVRGENVDITMLVFLKGKDCRVGQILPKSFVVDLPFKSFHFGDQLQFFQRFLHTIFLLTRRLVACARCT